MSRLKRILKDIHSLQQVSARNIDNLLEYNAMVGSIVLIQNAEHDVNDYTVTTSLLDTGTDAILRQNENNICSSTIRESSATINTAGK